MKRDLALFARWILKHYETSDISGYYCYRNPMGEIVDVTDIVNHYIREYAPEVCMSEELVKRFSNMKDLDPEYNQIISENFDYLTNDAPPPPPSRVIREGQCPVPPKKK